MSTIISLYQSLQREYNSILQTGSKPYLVKNSDGKIHFEAFSSCISVLFYRAIGYSFDIVDISSTLTNIDEIHNQITNAIDPSSSQKSIKEIFKILAIVENIIQRKSAHNPEMRDTRSGNRDPILKLAKKIAQASSKPTVEILLEHNFVDKAYYEVLHGSAYIGINSSLLQKLIPISAKAKDYLHTLSFVALGAQLDHDSKHLVRDSNFIKQALNAHNEEALTALLDQGLEPNMNIPDLNILAGDQTIPWVFIAASKGMHTAVSKAIEKGFSLLCEDHQGNTLLKYAMESQNALFCGDIASRIDPSIKNKNKATALFEFLKSTKITSQAKRRFLQDFIQPSNNSNISRLQGPLEFLSIRIDDLGINLIELLYLLGSSESEFKSMIYAHSYREEFDKSTLELKSKYPEKSINEFSLSHLKIHGNQYAHGVEVTNPGPKPQEIQTQDLIELFDGLNLTAPDAPYYLNPETLLQVAGVRSVREVRALLMTFSTKIVRREEFLGTPRARSEALVNFYDLIEQHLFPTLKVLKEKKSPHATLSVIKEFAAAAGKCGGRYFSVCVEQYLKVCENKVEKPAQYFFKSIAEYRGIQLLNAVLASSDGAHNVHNHNRALKEMGQELGIPGYQQAQDFDDIYIGQNYNSEEIKAEFLKSYTAPQLILDWILPQLKSDGTYREKYIDLVKEIFPESWKKSEYDAIKSKITHREYSNTSPSDKTKELLSQHDIAIAPNQSAEMAINTAQAMNFIEEYIYDENYQLRTEGLVYVLERLGVIQSSLPWKDRNKTVKQLQYGEESLYSISNLFSIGLDMVLSFFGLK